MAPTGGGKGSGMGGGENVADLRLVSCELFFAGCAPVDLLSERDTNRIVGIFDQSGTDELQARLG